MHNKRGKLNKDNKQVLKVFASFCMLIVSAAVFLVAVFSWATDGTIFGWFATDNSPSPSHFNTQINHGYNIDIAFNVDGGTQVEYKRDVLELAFNNIFAGNANAKQLTITHTNHETRDINISWWFGKPDAYNETPLENQGAYYYLGSQLAVSNIEMTVESLPRPLPLAQTPGKGKFLVTTSPLGNGQATSVFNPIENFDYLPLVNNAILPAGKTAAITVTFIFADNEEDQSIYQNFANNCSRVLYFKLAEVGA